MGQFFSSSLIKEENLKINCKYAWWMDLWHWRELRYNISATTIDNNMLEFTVLILIKPLYIIGD